MTHFTQLETMYAEVLENTLERACIIIAHNVRRSGRDVEQAIIAETPRFNSYLETMRQTDHDGKATPISLAHAELRKGAWTEVLRMAADGETLRNHVVAFMTD